MAATVVARRSLSSWSSEDFASMLLSTDCAILRGLKFKRRTAAINNRWTTATTHHKQHNIIQ
jgi:hypothetical protein